MGKTLRQKEALLRVNLEKRLGTQKFIEKAVAIHGEKFDYSQTEYINATTKLTIVCREHGPHIMLPHHHTKGHGCPMCGRQDINKKRLLSTEEFLEKIPYIKGISFEKTVYRNKREKVVVTCSIHGDYETKAEMFMKGCGCPKCRKSTGEDLVDYYLSKLGVNRIQQKTFEGLSYKRALKFDFYLPQYNACIEFDGEQHFKSVSYWGGEKGFKDLQIKDSMKNTYCHLYNIPLLRIRYDNENIEETIKEFLITLQLNRNT